MRYIRPLVILATLTTLWLAPITSPQGQGSNASVAYAGEGPTDPPGIGDDTTSTQPIIIDTTSSIGGPAPEEPSITEILIGYLMWIIT